MIQRFIKNTMVLLMAFLIVISGIFGSIGNIPVYADEENEEDVEENGEEGSDGSEEDDFNPSELISGKGNMRGLGSKENGREVMEALEEAAQYDIRMQFLVTYVILTDEFGRENGNYADIYSGKGEDNVGFPLETDWSKILDNIDSKSFNDPHGEGEDTDKDEDKDEDDGSGSAKDLAKDLAEKHAESIVERLGTSKEDRKKIKDSKKSEKGFVGYNLTGTGSGSTDGIAVTDGDDGIESFLKEKLKDRFLEILENQDFEEDTKIEDFVDTIEESLGTEPFQDYADEFRGNKYGFDTFTKDYVGMNAIEKKDGTLKNNPLVHSEFLRPEGYGNDGGFLKAAGIYADNGVGLKYKGKISEEQLDTILDFFPEYTRVSVFNNWDDITDQEMKSGKPYYDIVDTKQKEYNKVLKKKFKEDLQEKIEDDDKTYKAFLEGVNDRQDVKDEVGSGDRILSWMKISPNYGDIEGTDKVKLKEYLDDSTEDVSLEGDTLVQEEGDEKVPRPIQLRDLYFSDKSEKLLIAGNQEKHKVKYQIGKDSDSISEGISIGRYAGIKTKQAMFGKDPAEKDKSLDDSYNVSINKHIAARNEGYGVEIDSESNDIMGIDSYGNIIDSTTGTMVIPYWQNETVKRFGHKDKDVWLSHPIYKNDKADTLKDVVNIVDKVKEEDISKEDILDAFEGQISDKSLDSLKGKIKKNSIDFGSGFSAKDVGKIMEDKDNRIFIALAITAGTHEDVKSWNESFMKSGKKGEEQYVQIDVGRDTSSGGEKDKSKFEEYTDADLRERIMMILDYGFYEVLRLTVAGWVVNIYNTGFIHYTMSSVFHTTTIADTDVYEDLLVVFSTLLASVVGAYVLWMGLQVFRQQMRMMEVVKQFIMITIIVLIPTMIYAPFVDLVINKPTPFFLGKNMEQTMILDNHLHDIEKEREESEDDAYRYLFSGNQEIRDKTQDYIIKFYTTTHKKGYDIEDVDYDDLNWTDRIKMSNAEQTGGWDTRDVESVRVSVYDLFDWLREKVDKDEDGTDLGLFEWLESSHPSRYENVSDFNEISYDPNFGNENLGILKEDGVQAEEIKASELMERLYESSSAKVDGGKNLKERIKNMSYVSEVIKSNDRSGFDIDKEEVESIIRDFSLSSQGRELAFGTEDIKENLVEKHDSDTPNVSNKTIKAWSRISDQKLLIPENDYMNLESMIDEINPDNGDPRNVPNDKVIYNVNRDVISDYINVQSLVRESVGSKVEKSEFMAITLNEFFKLNDELDIPMFPTKIEPDSISLDSFARMIFIPMQEYQQDDADDLNNLAEYLTLRDNPFMLLVLFVPALLALVLWGMFYLVIFGFLLLVASVVTFFWQYIIRRDMQNKSWLGSLWIVLRLALAKLGLLALWFGMAYIMNYMYNRFGGFTYAYTYVHSLIIIAYVFFCTKHVFLKTLRQVRENPSELGGSAMMNGFKDMLGRFKNGKVFGRNKPSGDTKGADEKKSVEKALDNEGSEGAISAGNLSKIATNFRNIKDRFMGDGHAEVDDILNEIDPLGNRMSRRFPKITKGVKGSSRKEMLGDYDAIGSTEGISKTSSGMLESMAAAGELGQVMSSSADGSQIAKLAVGSVENASRMVSHLNKQGLKAWNDDEGNVYYNSQGVDLESAEVRKGLYGGLLEEYYNEIDEDTSLQEQTEENVNPYTQLDNGNLKIDVGDKGISTSNVDAILGSTEFRDSFVLESSPVKGMNGEYIQGSLVVKPRNGVDEQSVMNQMFSADTRLREERGEQERGEIEQNKSISFEGLQDFENVNKYIKNGMSLQGNKIIYDSNNSKHVKSVSKLKNKINSENESKYGEKLEFMTNLASHTAYGDDSGINVEYSNTSQDKEVHNFARKTGLVGDKVESKVYAGDSAKRISKNIKEARNLLSMDNETINDYHQKRDDLFRFGDTAFIGEDENYDKGFNKLFKSAKKVGGDKEQLQGRMDEYTDLGRKFQNASITEQEYNRGVEALYSDLQTDLQDNGTFAKVLSKEVRREKAPKELKTSFDAYVKSKRNLEDSGVSSDMVERFNSAEFTDLMDTLDNIDDIEDNGDGTLNIKSDEALNTDDTKRIIEKMEGFDSKEE